MSNVEFRARLLPRHYIKEEANTMTTRITDKHLEGLIRRLNKLTGMPEAPYAKDADGNIKPQAGSYHLSHAYGGVCLHRMSLTEGCTGVTTPLGIGHIPKRELCDQIYAFIRGIETVKYGD